MSKNELETTIENAARRFEQGMKNWVKNDRVFDGFRNTYARILLWALGYLTLFGGLWVCYQNESGILWYSGLVLANVAAQKLSVRFVFDDKDELVDEYQSARRDRAYRRAYRNTKNWAMGLITMVLAWQYVRIYLIEREAGFLGFWPSVVLDVNLDSYRTLVILVFLTGLFVLQPYWAWGFKGEPWRSKDEPNE